MLNQFYCYIVHSYTYKYFIHLNSSHALYVVFYVLVYVLKLTLLCFQFQCQMKVDSEMNMLKMYL